MSDGYRPQCFWQGRYYDHVIRPDVEHFFIQRYIELNPLLWYLNSENPGVHNVPVNDLCRGLKDIPGLDARTVAYLTDVDWNSRRLHELGLEGDPHG